MKELHTKIKKLVNRIEESFFEFIGPSYKVAKEKCDKARIELIKQELIKKYGKLKYVPFKEFEEKRGITKERDDLYLKEKIKYATKIKEGFNRIEESLHGFISPRYAAIKENIERDRHDAIIEDMVRQHGALGNIPFAEFEKRLGITEIRDDTGPMGSLPAYFNGG